MFPTIRESAAVVSIILLLMLFLPARLPSRYRRPIVVALLVVVLMLLLVPLLLQFFYDPRLGLSGSGLYTGLGRALWASTTWRGLRFAPSRCPKSSSALVLVAGA